MKGGEEVRQGVGYSARRPAKRKALRRESWGVPTSKDRLGREPEGGLRGNAEREKLGRSGELPTIRHY